MIPAFFQHTFEQKLLQEIEEYGKYAQLRAGETLFEAGSLMRVIPIVISGIMKITRIDEDGKELLLYYLTEGDSCALAFTCCMQHMPSEVKATAEEDTEALLLPINIMENWIAKYPTWKSFVMQTIHNRFIEMLKTIDQIAFQNLDERLINYLKEKAKILGSTVLNISHDQIAGELATSRVVISRLLKKLENNNKIILYRSQIKILSDL